MQLSSLNSMQMHSAPVKVLHSVPASFMPAPARQSPHNRSLSSCSASISGRDDSAYSVLPCTSYPLHSRHHQRRIKRALAVAHSSSSSGSSILYTEQQQDSSSAAPTPSSNTSHPQQEQEDDVLIEFRDVYKSFGNKPILEGASFKIRRGEAVGIIGASGTGKSTTLRIAAGLLAPDKGEIYIHGKKRTGLISDSAEEEKVRVGMVFQNAALFDSLKVGENVGFLLYEHSDLPADEIRRLVADSLAKVGLRGVEDLYPAELSGGMRKRVALARAVIPDLANDTEKVVMYDEPTAGLDPVASTVVEDLMRDLHNDSKQAALELASINGSNPDGVSLSKLPPPPGGISSYVVVTHQHSTIRRAVDRIIFLHKGTVVWEGSSTEFDTTDEPIVRQFSVGSLDGPISYV